MLSIYSISLRCILLMNRLKILIFYCLYYSSHALFIIYNCCGHRSPLCSSSYVNYFCLIKCKIVGNFEFAMNALPVHAQLAPVYGIAYQDVNGDAHPDLFLVGNFYGLKPQTGRLDASFGTTLTGDGKGSFSWLPPAESGLWIRGECRDVKTIQAGNKNVLVVALNNGPLHIFSK